jgi:predicted MPP superfamily phosphohydrolase
MILAIVFFLSVYAALNGYVFYRIWKLAVAGHLPLAIYIALALLVASSFILGMLLGTKVLKLWGSFWMIGLVYSFFLFLLCDLYLLLRRWIELPGIPAWLPTAGLILIALLLVGGYVNARQVHIVDYTLPVPAVCPELDVVVVSDLHLGDIIGLDRYAKMIEEINALDADLVLMAGDIFDGSLTQVSVEGFSELSRNLQSRLGVYAVLGNHDQYAGPESQVAPPFAAGNILLLRDEMVSPVPGLYLAGGRPVQRAESADMLAAFAAQAAENGWPVIFLDHIPSRLALAREAGILLTLSGHTHGGQVAPANLITRAIFENSYGHQTLDGTHSIVSSGYGTWGPPLRIGTHAEIVRIHLTHE